MKSRLRSILTFLIGWPLSFIALFFIVRLIMTHSKELEVHLADINYSLIILGGICFFLYYLFRSLVYKKILNFLGYSLSLRDTAYFWGQSELHRYIPGNVWSFLGRTVLFSRKKVEKKDIATSLIVETQLVLLGTLVVTALGATFITETFLKNFPFHDVIPFAFRVSVAILLFLYVYSVKFSHKIRFNLIKRIVSTPFLPLENFILLVVSCFCYILFGLGYYFTSTAIFPMSPQLVWQLTGFFAFSLLVGYVSLLTPTGLGIREGILVLGLSQFAPSALVGFASIFTRVLLIICEILYLIVSFAWLRLKNPILVNGEKWMSENRHLVILSCGILIYSLYFTTASFLRYDNFYTGRFDLGNMAQTVWNSSQGRLFDITNPNGTEQVSRLAFHADFILVMLAPLYFIWSDPRMLLLIQTIIVALGAVFVYLLGKDVLQGRSLPLLIAFVYLINPSLQRANLYDFHAVTLATTFLLGAFYFLRKKSDTWFLIFLFLAAITKEQVWLIVAFFGIYIFLFQKRRMFGAILSTIGISMFGFLIFYAIPRIAGAQHFALAYYSDFGDKPGAIIKNVFFSPHKTLPILLESDRLSYIQQLIAPVGMIALLSPFYLLFASADAGINLLSSNPQLHQIYYQYTSTITPFLFIALIFGTKRLLDFFPNLPRITVAIYLGLVAIYSAYIFGPLPGSKSANLDMFTRPQPNAIAIDNYLKNIPRTYSVSASNNLGSHLSHRETIYTLPLGIDKADVIAVLPDSTTSGSGIMQRDIIQRLRANPNYMVYDGIEGFIVFQKLDTFHK